MAFLVRAPAPGARTQRRQAARRAQPQARRIAEGAPRHSAAPRTAVGASYVTPIDRKLRHGRGCGARRLVLGRRPPATPRLLSGGTCSATSANWWRRSCRPRRRAPAGRPGCCSAVTPRAGEPALHAPSVAVAAARRPSTTARVPSAAVHGSSTTVRGRGPGRPGLARWRAGGQRAGGRRGNARCMPDRSCGGPSVRRRRRRRAGGRQPASSRARAAKNAMSCEASAPEPWPLMTADRGVRLAPPSLQLHPSLVCSIALLDGCARHSHGQGRQVISAGAGRSGRPLAGAAGAAIPQLIAPAVKASAPRRRTRHPSGATRARPSWSSAYAA
jgi:hypothetical protein